MTNGGRRTYRSTATANGPCGRGGGPGTRRKVPLRGRIASDAAARVERIARRARAWAVSKRSDDEGPRLAQEGCRIIAFELPLHTKEESAQATR